MNANWPEITSNLLPGQTAYDRPELCCRVFNMKLEEIMAGLKSCKVFGPYMAHLGVIEFQKRCYPHAHLVYTFTSQGPQRMNEMDKWVWARIPDENIANGLLRGKVLKYMIHKPCGPFQRHSYDDYLAKMSSLYTYMGQPDITAVSAFYGSACIHKRWCIRKRAPVDCCMWR